MLRLACSLVLLMQATATSAGEPAEPPVSFRNQVAPILVKACLGCHNAKKAEGGLNMATFALLKRGGDGGAESILEPGDPEASQLIELVRKDGQPRMPYKQPPLSEAQIKTLERWVKEGATFDGPSEAETPIASLVDPLKDLPKVPLEAPVAEAWTSLAYTPDGKWLAGAAGRSVRLVDAATGKVDATLDGHPGPLTTVRITPDGRTLVAAGGRPGLFGSITVWDLASRSKRHEIKAHRDSILGADLSPDGKLLATASYDRQIKLWNLEQGKELKSLVEHTDAVYSVAFAPDSSQLASAGADRTVKIWDLSTGKRLKSLSDATAELYAVTFAADGKAVLAGGVDRSIHVWSLEAQGTTPVRSVFAHDAAILRLVVSSDGKSVVSSSEDGRVKIWDLPGLATGKPLENSADWPQGLAVRPDGKHVAIGRFDGSLAALETSTGKLVFSTQQKAEAKQPAKPELVRTASLNPPSPRGASRGTKLKLTLTGNGVGHATSLVFPEPGLTGTIVRASKPDEGNPNRLEIELVVASDARVGSHRFSLITPLGVAPFQAFAVSAAPEVNELAPKPPADAKAAQSVRLPATLTGTIESPGDVDRFRFDASAGEFLVFETDARSLGSPLLGVLSLEDDQGRILGESSAGENGEDPVLSVLVPHAGVVTLRVTDADYGGSPGHFYRVAAGRSAYLTDVFPLGVTRGERASIEVKGSNLQGVSRVPLATDPNAEVGAMSALTVRLPDGASPLNQRTVVVGAGRQGVEAAEQENGRADRAEPVAVPGGISGRIVQNGDADHFRFEAKRGERLILEVFGRRLGTAIDPVIEILDAKGVSIPRAVLRPLEQTEVAFRDHNSSQPGIRLTRWGNLAVGDFVLFGRELARIRALPRNPDDDCIFWNERNQRIGFLGTTPEHHPISQPMYKVAIHPPGTEFPPGGVAPVTLTHRNDDGGPDTSKDSRLTFEPPQDGVYIVRVEDVRGLGGEAYGYHLLIRRPEPRFRLSLSTENPGVPRGGTTLVTATIARLDGFAGPVDVTVDGLPAGITTTSTRIEPEDDSASFAISADRSAPTYSRPTWHVTARTPADSVTHERNRVQELDPGGTNGGWIVVMPEPNLQVKASSEKVTIQPGQKVSLKLTVNRGPAFAGRVPIDVRNLPQGVRVLDIGLNGVLIPEKESERTVTLFAEPWVGKTVRPFYAVGKAEAAGTEHSSSPIELIVGPAPSAPSHAANVR